MHALLSPNLSSWSNLYLNSITLGARNSIGNVPRYTHSTLLTNTYICGCKDIVCENRCYSVNDLITINITGHIVNLSVSGPITGTFSDLSYMPDSIKTFPIAVVNNGQSNIGLLEIYPNGSFTVYSNGAADDFGDKGIGGFPNTSVTYCKPD